ncbi:MAG: sigma-70 family RNA polymerase sigma factor [Xanthomonadaceae bacterium]|nr:sigma-70 family RNA polymerase sigma factor [Xanthomonadaceae bacterium]MDE3072118.1 sigma-70 family RNA polymerase sigma factor [Pseudomonadota bacterium]
MDDIRSPDRELVDAVLANRPGAFERLIGEYQGLCWHIIYRMVRHPEDARELCQDTFLRVHQCLHQYRHESALKSWIGRVAYTIALRHLQHKRIPLVDAGGEGDDYALVEQVGDGFDLESACADEEIAQHLHAAIDTLPPLQRMLLTLYYLDEMPIAEMAKITGLASGTIKSHLFRSRLRLRGVLESRTGVAA